MLQHNAVEVLVTSKETGGRFTVCRLRTENGGGLPLHEHLYEDGFFFVLEGEYRFEIGDKPSTAAQGTSVFVPRGTAHKFRQVSDGAATLLVVSMPGGFDLFIQDLRGTERVDGPGVWTALAPLFDKHGIRILE
jgi:mannose-6-phosphate isomerase-like protein (cupin superfamily)